MVNAWREAAQTLFGGDRLSNAAGQVEEAMKRILAEEGHMCKDRDYRVLLATLCRYKEPVKVKIYPKEFMALRTWGSSQTSDPVGPYLDPDSPPNAPFEHKSSGCDEDCERCFPQYFPAQREIFTEDAQEATRMLAHAIENDYNYLRCVIKTHGGELARLWNKMSQRKRHNTLDESGDLCIEQPTLGHMTNANMRIADDNPLKRMASKMTDTHLPDAQSEFYVRFVWQQMIPAMLEVGKTKFLDTWFFPYLDTESLSRFPLSFLGLLSSRTQYAPYEWALFDKMHIVAAEQFQVIPSQYNPNCISFHPDDYGCLRDWDRALAHQQTILGYTQGIFVLTAQGRMMSFLRKVVDSVLRDVLYCHRPEEVPGYVELDTSKHQSLPVQQKWLQLVGNGFSTFGMQPKITRSSYTNQQLVAPPHADPVVLRNRICAVYQDAFDGLWALQTDPSTVQLAVKEFGSCLYFHYLDKEKEWDRIAEEVLLAPIMREFLWRQTLKECDRLMDAHESFKMEDTEENRLRFDASMLVLHDCCTEQLTWAILDLQSRLPYQPGFEKNYEWKRGSDGQQKTPDIHTKDWFMDDPLFWSLDCLCNDRYREFNCDPVVDLKAFDDELQKATEKERRRISPSFLKLVGDLAAIDEIRTAIQCTRGINQNSIKEFSTDTRFRAESKRRFGDVKTFNKTRNEILNVHVLCKATAPQLKELCTQHRWPKGTPTTDTAQRATDARDILAKIWRQIRRVSDQAVIKHGMDNTHMQEYVDKWSLDLSQEYQNLRQAEQSEIKTALQAQFEARARMKAPGPTAALRLRSKPLTTTQSSLSSNLRKEVLRDISTNKQKIKTHGKGFYAASSAARDESIMSAVIELKKERIKVKLSSLPLLYQMLPAEGHFNKSNTSDTTGTGLRRWKWQHFVDVMLDTGFGVSQGSGSAVSFEHPSGMGRIVFHQPHPQPTIDPVMLRFMGRRMNRWFGWQRDIFVERE